MLSEEKSRQIEMAGTDWACMMLVCINGHENNEPYGVIANYHLSHPVSFRGIHRLILALDEVCEMVGSPMATTEPRFLLNEWEQQYRGCGEENVPLYDSCEGGHPGPCAVQTAFLHAGQAPVQLHRSAFYRVPQRPGTDAYAGRGKHLYVREPEE